ncbi:hypothetical protein JNUCC64_20270 [Streptomyces sp. JNUCC 64]
MRSGTRRACAAVPAVALALLLVGCGAGGTGEKVATAGGGKKTGGAAGPELSPEKAALKLTECLRENGVEVEDPEPDGGVRIDGGAMKDVDRSKVDEAMAACRKYAPQGVGKGGDPKAMDRMRDYAKCMRENGVEEFPDPENGGMRLDPEMVEDPDFMAAEKKCKPRLGKGGGGMLNGKEG